MNGLSQLGRERNKNVLYYTNSFWLMMIEQTCNVLYRSYCFVFPVLVGSNRNHLRLGL